MLNIIDVDDQTIKKGKRGRPKKTDTSVKSSYIVKNKQVNPVKDFKKSYLVILKINDEDVKLYKINNITNTNINTNINTNMGINTNTGIGIGINTNTGIGIGIGINTNTSIGLNNDSKEIKEDLTINNFYNKNIIPLLNGNVPIKLFDKELTESDYIENNNKEYIKNNSNLICPLFKQTNGNKWPSSSPYRCYNCHCFFSGVPVGAPVKIYKETIECTGNYCDYGCMLRDLYETLDINEFIEKYSIICTMYSIQYGIDDFQLVMALSKYMLLEFGGKLTYQEYHDYHKINKDSIIEVEKYPFVPSIMRIYDVKIQSNIKMNFEQEFRKKKIEVKEKLNIPIDKEKLEKSKNVVKQLKQIYGK